MSVYEGVCLGIRVPSHTCTPPEDGFSTLGPLFHSVSSGFTSPPPPPFVCSFSMRLPLLQPHIVYVALQHVLKLEILGLELVLTILGFWYFLVNFRTNFLASAEKLRIGLNLESAWGRGTSSMRSPRSSQVNLHFFQHSVVLRTRLCVLLLHFPPISPAHNC